MKARKNLRRITQSPPFETVMGRRMCSNTWARFMMERMDRQERLVTAGFIVGGRAWWQVDNR